jgi:hypothetical protein
MMRLWQTTLNHQERKYAHWAKNSEAVQKSSAAGQPRSYGICCCALFALPGRAKQVAIGKARTGATVVEATSHFVQTTATGPLIT